MPKRSSSRPRSTRSAAAGCSSISLCMKDSCSPASYIAGSMSRVVAARAVAVRSCRYVVKPPVVTVAISPSSRWATVVVYRTSAPRSEATYISLSPTPMISGLPLRATTIRSGKPAWSTARP